MNCPTCDHTMHVIAPFNPDRNEFVGPKISHCLRCGTQKVEWQTKTDIYMPTLVERCREFANKIGVYTDPDAMPDLWKQLGIAKAINKPEDRK